ncbi:MAG: radical SAM protein [Candidatus Jorgensenbacteria bacterium]
MVPNVLAHYLGIDVKELLFYSKASFLPTPKKESTVMKVFPIIKCADIACDLRCAYCFYRYMDQNVKSDSIMPLSVLEKLTEQILEINSDSCNFLWHGGEPLLAGMDFFGTALKFQGRYKKENTHIINGVQTNGVLIDKKWARFFKENNFRVGISIDGPEGIHDYYRKAVGGQGSFPQVMRGIRYCREEELNFGTITVVTSHSANFPEEIYRFLKDVGVKKMAFNPAFEMDNEGNVCDFSVSDPAFSTFLEKILLIWLEEDDPTVEIRQFIDPMRGMLGGNPSACIYSGLCEQFLDIYPSGNVRPCHSRNGEADVLGNILSERLIDILQGENYRQFLLSVRKPPTGCLGCHWFSICHGGCTDYRNLSADGSMGDKYFYCGSRKAVFNILEEKLKANEGI